MEVKKEKTILKTIMFLSVIGFIIALYLFYNHYAHPSAGSICDLGSILSCSVVNTSKFSEFLSVPVALFGAMWFVILFFVCLELLKDKEHLYAGKFAWVSFGLLFVFYMVIAEIILKAVCIFCTFLHLIIVIIFVMSLLIYRKRKPKFMIKDLRKWIMGIILINLIPILLFNLSPIDQENHDGLAKCITEKEITVYSSIYCSHCKRQKEILGDSYQFINVIECSPNAPNSQWKLCQEKNITGTPTWILEENGREVKRNSGFMTIEELKDFSKCE